ncbi:hypothetical protein SGLAM104S_09167 [Streptomyces glaucescens]
MHDRQPRWEGDATTHRPVSSRVPRSRLHGGQAQGLGHGRPERVVAQAGRPGDLTANRRRRPGLVPDGRIGTCRPRPSGNAKAPADFDGAPPASPYDVSPRRRGSDTASCGTLVDSPASASRRCSLLPSSRPARRPPSDRSRPDGSPKVLPSRRLREVRRVGVPRRPWCSRVGRGWSSLSRRPPALTDDQPLSLLVAGGVGYTEPGLGILPPPLRSAISWIIVTMHRRVPSAGEDRRAHMTAPRPPPPCRDPGAEGPGTTEAGAAGPTRPEGPESLPCPSKPSRPRRPGTILSTPTCSRGNRIAISIPSLILSRCLNDISGVFE